MTARAGPLDRFWRRRAWDQGPLLQPEGSALKGLHEYAIVELSELLYRRSGWEYALGTESVVA